MSLNAFGIEHVSKASKDRPEHGPTAGRIATGALFPVYHGAVAGKQGHKLKAMGYELGGGLVAGPVGAGVGTYAAHEQGHYKKQKVKKSATGERGDKRNSKYVGAAYGGAVAGAVAGENIGARRAGRSRGAVRREAAQNTMRHMGPMMDAGERFSSKPSFKGARDMGREAHRAGKAGYAATEGGTAMMHGGTRGALAGAALGVGAYAAHRHNSLSKAYGFEDVSKASDELIHVGRDAVGYGLGGGARKAGRTFGHKATGGRKGAYKIHEDHKPDDAGPAGIRHVKVQAHRGALLAGGAAAGYEGISEGDRRLANRKGANVGALEYRVHPFRSGNKIQAARARSFSQKYGASAARSEAKGKQAPIRRSLQNRTAYVSHVDNRAAQVGGLRARHEAGPYNPKQKYTPPTTIGKSNAFGIDSGREISKLAVGDVLEGAKNLTSGIKTGLTGGTPGFHGSGARASNAGVKIGNVGQKGALTAIDHPFATLGVAAGAAGVAAATPKAVNGTKSGANRVASAVTGQPQGSGQGW